MRVSEVRRLREVRDEMKDFEEYLTKVSDDWTFYKMDATLAPDEYNPCEVVNEVLRLTDRTIDQLQEWRWLINSVTSRYAVVSGTGLDDRARGK